MVSRAAVCVASLLASLAGCGRPPAPGGPLPTPAELPLGTFVADLEGVAYSVRDTVRLAERVEGTACLLGDYVLLDSRDFSRRFLFYFPGVTAPAARHRLALQRADRAGANGHLNHRPLMRRQGFASLRAVGGHADLTAPSPADVRGVLRARLAHAVLTGPRFDDLTADTTHGVVALTGSFRADTRRGERCGDPP